MTPKGRLRKALRLLDHIDAWNDRTDRLPTYVLDALYQAQGLVAVTIDDFDSTGKLSTREK